MATEKGRETGRSDAGPAMPRSERRKIPLPPLPQFRQDPPGARPVSAASAATAAPAQPGALTQEEADHLIGTPHIEAVAGAAAPSPRTGAIGASVLNDIVEEIERDLERDLARHAPAASVPAYRRTVGCSFVRR